MNRDDGFDQFFLALLPQVLGVALRLTGNQAMAEDLAAEAFARAFARWPKVSALSYREAWVTRVASTLAIDDVRRRRVHIAAGLPAVPDVVDPADLVAQRNILVHALASLPKSQRDAVVLRYLADFSEGDVAAALGVKPGTVKSHLHRGIAALRGHLGDNLEEIGYGIKTA